MRLGSHHSLQTLKKLSESHKGKKQSKETRIKIGNFQKGNKWSIGRKHTLETKSKMSRSHKKLFENGKIQWNKGLTKETDIRMKRLSLLYIGRKLPEEQKNKIKEKMKLNPPMKNKHHTKETKLKLSIYHKGKKPSKESIEKGRLKKIGHKVSEETRKKIGYSNSKKIRSKEFREYLSKIQKGKHHSPKTEFKKGQIFPKGKESPSWKGGLSFEPYGIEFNKEIRNRIRKRDNQICMNCGIHREQLSRALSIHHINYDKKCNLEQNFISLCVKCHSITNNNREYWKKLFQEKLSKLYNYKYDVKGNIILEIQDDILEAVR